MPSASEIRLKDPLSDVTRKERRSLLGVSALGIVMVKTGLVPSKISALGIDFSPTDQKTILRAVAVVVGYFLVAFLVYAASDFFAWRYALRSAVREAVIKREEEELKGAEDWNKRVADRVDEVLRHQFGRELEYWRFGIKPVSTLRATFEFILPVLVGTYAIHCLL